MKQLLFCYKENRILRVRYTILTDVFVPVQDVISPQKSTLIIPKTDRVELNDIIIIRDNDTNVIEYIGYIDTLTNKTNTEISCYPLINVFDNDYVLDQMFETVEQEKLDENGQVIYENNNPVMETVDADIDVIQWLETQLQRAFINTDDKLQALPLIIRNNTNQPVFYKKVLDTANLFEVYTDIFIDTGVYIVFSELSYDGYNIDHIYCDIYCNKDEKPLNLRWDNPQIQSVDIVDNTFTNYNKLIVTEKLPENPTAEQIANRQRYYFYLLNDNSITTNPNDERRIKQVRSKEMTFDLSTDGETGTDEEKIQKRVNALMLAVFNELQAPEYNLQITITMFKNNNIKLYRRVDFTAESGIIYSSNVTKIEILNDKQITVTLGALRNSLTDFKKKVEAI